VVAFIMSGKGGEENEARCELALKLMEGHAEELQSWRKCIGASG
jgi:hypothetical protein